MSADEPRGSGSGAIAFLGYLFANGGSTFEGEALFASDTAGDLAMVVREDDPAPGLPAGTRFGEFSQQQIGTGGGPLFRNGLRETPNALPVTTSLWNRTGYGETPQLLWRKGDLVPGAPFPLSFAFGFLNQADQVSVFAVDSSGADLILLGDGAHGLIPLIREGDAEPGGLTGTVLRVICCGGDEDPFSRSASGIAFTGLLEIGPGGVDASNDSVLFGPDGSGGITVRARKGDPIPGRPGEVWGDLSRPRINDAGQILVENGYPNSVRELVLLDPQADPVVVAKTGQQAPGFPAGTTFDSIGSSSHPYSPSVLSDSGAVSFSAFLLPYQEGVLRAARFFRAPSGLLSKVAGEGDVVEIRPDEFRTIYQMEGGSLDEAGNVLLTLYEENEFQSIQLVAFALYPMPEPGFLSMLAAGVTALAILSRRERSTRH